MPKLKIVEPGWQGYTGFVGMVNFVDGVSVDPIHHSHADAIAAMIAMVEVDDDGEEVGHYGIQTRMQTERAIEAELLAPLSTATKELIAAATPKTDAAATAGTGYTVEALQKIADQDGINGLRVIAAPLGIRGRAIPDLIEAILKRQAEIKGVGQTLKPEVNASDVVIEDADAGKKAIPAAQAQQASPAEQSKAE